MVSGFRAGSEMRLKPLMVELFAGLHGWGEAAAQEGFRVVGFDIVDMCAELGTRRPDGCQLVLQDVLTLHGSQFEDAAVIVASPPCQAYSYRAMPWKRARALPPPSNELFDACFRIQREASEAAGRYIPLVLENVRGAQKWVGRAKWHYGSFYLWGDVPALMPTTFAAKVPGFRFDGSGKSFQTASLAETGRKVPAYSDPRRNGGRGKHLTSQRENAEGIKQNGSGPIWFDTGIAKHSSHSDHSDSRKQASAEIAKIPFPLAQHIAKVFYPSVELAGPTHRKPKLQMERVPDCSPGEVVTINV